MKNTLAILSVFVEIAAIGRAAIATFLVVQAVTNDLMFSIFTVAVIEGVFLTSLFLMHQEAVAPIAALLALGFSALMQYFELRVLDGSISPSERDMLRYAVAFAPVVILALSYVRRLVLQADGDSNPLAEKVSGLWGRLKESPPKKMRGSKKSA
ncbi:MAG TPA: hypothetical protein VFD70_24440 [Anaerolineae bacterium]|nr:hypothetical protein [Anaerolineae bacterium]